MEEENLTKREREEIQRNKDKRNKTIRTFLTLIVIVILVGLFVAYMSAKQEQKEVSPEYLNPSGLSEAQMLCIAEQYKFYGTESCPHCKTQKDIMGKLLVDLTYIDCGTDTQKCVDAGVNGVPYGIAINKINSSEGVQRVVGPQSVETILEITGCING